MVKIERDFGHRLEWLKLTVFDSANSDGLKMRQNKLVCAYKIDTGQYTGQRSKIPLSISNSNIVGEIIDKIDFFDKIAAFWFSSSIQMIYFMNLKRQDLSEKSLN